MNEENILKILAENPKISQRKIAQQTGISLGQVNFLIKKCVKKGMIKIEGQSPKSLKYNLTPKGMKEKAELTLKYIKLSYKAIVELSDQIRSVVSEQMALDKRLYIFGSKDEVFELVDMILKEKDTQYQYIENVKGINLNDNYVILVWEHSYESQVKEFNHINIIK